MGRSLVGILSTLPGVTSTDYSAGGPSSANPSVRGEGSYGNNYLLEGFSIRDPLSKTLGLSLPFDALQEVNVFTDGAPAEFGGFTGMITNVLLKSGTNEVHGSLAYYYSRHLSTGTYEILNETTTKRRFAYQSPTITLGGPIVEDKLWFFGVFDYRNGWRQPEGSDVVSALDYNYMFLGRITYSPIENGNTLINFTVQKQGTLIDNAGAGATVAEEATVRAYDDLVHLNLNLKSVLSPSVVLEVKANRSVNEYYEETRASSVLSPAYSDVATGYHWGNTAYLYSTARERQGFAFHLTRFVADLAGQHMFKGGYEYHQYANEDEFVYTGGVGTPEAPAYEYILDDGQPYIRVEHYNVGPIGHQGINSVFFLQDQWQPAMNLTLNLGVRAEGETLLQNAGFKTVSEWSFAPRFGLAWDITGEARHLVSVNAGRYYDINGLGFVQWADTLSPNYFTLCQYNPDDGDYDTGCFTQDPVLDPSTYADDLKPYFMDKFTLGYTRAITDVITVGLKGIVSTTRNLPEDVNVDGNLWEIRNPGDKHRDYWGIELTAKRRFADNWQFLGSVTFSSAKGTNPGSFETGSDESSGGNGNEVGIYMDDIADPYARLANDYFGIDFAGMGYAQYEAFGETYPANTAGWYGYLPYHSFVVAKLSASYLLPSNTELGVTYAFDSGHAWQRRGLQPLYGSHSIFPEGRGTRFMPPVHTLDARIAQHLSAGKNLDVLAEIVVFNVLDSRTPIYYYENFDPGKTWEVDQDGRYYYRDDDGETVYSLFGSTMARQAPRSIRANLKLTF